MNSENIELAIKFLGLLGLSSIAVTFIKNSQAIKLKHREIVAEASKSVLKRVEMYYRIRRRTGESDDIISIRNMFHQVQEENEYFKTLLVSRSKWHGERYVLFISAIQKLTADETREAWRQTPFGPDAEVKPEDRPNHKRINELSLQFAKDSRKLMNPFSRSWMAIRDSSLGKKIKKIKSYDV